MYKKILAPIFTSNMVLQRRKPIPFWGTVAPHDTVTLSINAFSTTCVADETGKWYITAPPMEAAVDLDLIVCDSTSRVRLQNVAIGEVWLAGGQSNMEFPLSQSTEWPLFEKPSSRNPRVRFFYTPKVPYRNEEYYEQFDLASWQTIESKGFGDWSSVGYQFAAELADELQVTIGVIGCNWGGTSASAWMSREHIMAYDDTRSYIEEFEAGIQGQSPEEQYRAYDAYLERNNAWDKKCQELYTNQPTIEWEEVQRILGPCEWPGPMNLGNPYRPCGLYDQMLMEICPYALAGFIFYQGESDDHKPHAYYHLFSEMIRNWREDWGDNELPFLFTQLPMHRYKADPDFKNWPIIREAQLRVFEEVKNTGIAIATDCGVWNDIHPKSKEQVAHRLALQALYHVYKKISERKAMSPSYDYKVLRGAILELHFKNAESLQLQGAPTQFEIAGADKVFYPATVRISGKATIELTSEDVPAPIYGRYAWTNYCIPSLFDKNGLPVSPFRTDATDGSDVTTGTAVTQQIMET